MKYRIVLRGDNPDMELDFSDNPFHPSVLGSGNDGWLVGRDGKGVLMSEVVAFESIDDAPAETPEITEKPSRDGLFGLVDGEGDFWVHIPSVAGELWFALMDDLLDEVASKTFDNISFQYGVAKVITR